MSERVFSDSAEISQYVECMRDKKSESESRARIHKPITMTS